MVYACKAPRNAGNTCSVLKFNSGEATMKGSISETSASLPSRNQKAAACHQSEMFTRIKPATGSSMNITQGMCSAQMQQHYIPLLRNPFLPCSYHDCARISCPRHCLVCSPTRITGSQSRQRTWPSDRRRRPAVAACVHMTGHPGSADASPPNSLFGYAP